MCLSSIHPCLFIKVYQCVCCSLLENADLLHQRLRCLNESREQLEDNLRQRVAYNRSLEREMHALKPEVFNLLKLKDKHAA